MTKRPTNILNNAVILLSGPIDNSIDDGIGIRKEIINKCRAVGIEAHFLDPTDKPTNGFKEVGEEKKKLFQLKQEGQFSTVAAIARSFRYQDLRMVDISDIVIVHIDPNIHMSGTYEELYRAKQLDRKMFVIVNGGMAYLPNWLFGVFSSDEVFESVDECVQCLLKINKGEYEFDPMYVQTKSLLEKK
jgi:hypothetical protein